MSKYWSKTLKGLKPYVPGEQPRDKKYIKLNTNENPYPPSPSVLEAIKTAADEGLRLYPDPACDELRLALAQYYGLNKEQVFVGNGSDEILAFAFMAFFDPGKAIVFPDVTYSFYPVYAKLFNIDYELAHLNDDFHIPLETFLKNNGGVILPNPNAPTGIYMPLESIERILKHNRDYAVVIDEAYVDFGGESAVRLIKDYANLLVIQTMSKSRALAGLRVGFALGQEDMIEGLHRVKNSFNSYTLDRIALAGAVKAVQDNSYFEEIRNCIISTRERVSEALRDMGFIVTPSMANFLFITHPKVCAEYLFKQLRHRGILVRYFKEHRIDNHLRVSIGTDIEMNIFLDAVSQILRAV